VKRFAASWRADALLAAALLAWTLACLATQSPGVGRDWLVLVLTAPYAAALAFRRRWPLASALVACAVFLAVRPLGLVPVFNGTLGDPYLWVLFLLCYALGAGAALGIGLAMTVLLAVSAVVANQGFDPIIVMLTLGPWLAGRVVLSQRRMTDRLHRRNEELEAERELFALESVRYERARIARELHDIVAHCLSVMVIQASAGQRVVEAVGVAQALESVAEAAEQAKMEVGRLVSLLGGRPLAGPPPGLDMIDELVRRAGLSGQVVTCRVVGRCGLLGAAASEAAYRLVQEALTNSVKHAPGAAVEITIQGCEGTVEVSVVNAAPARQRSGVERSGGSYGLDGMRERVAGCGGSFGCGPTPAGGWRVSALLPAEAVSHRHSRAG
jgi:signal transduction histidine kinase